MADIDSAHSRAVIAALAGESNAKKGYGFEALVTSMFGAVPGLDHLTVRKRNLKNTGEIDVAFQVRSGCPLESFGSVLLIECKNQGAKLSPLQVLSFARKLRDAHLPGGVMVTLSPVSGSDDDLTGARSELDTARKDGTVIVVLERAELEAVASGEHLAAALELKYMMMRVYGRHELVPASDLRHTGIRVMTGAAAMRKAINGARRVVIDEALEHRTSEPPDLVRGAEGIAASLDDVAFAVEVARQQDDMFYAGPRAALIGLIRLCISTLPLLDSLMFEAGDSTIRSNIVTSIPERLHVPLGGQLWALMTRHFVDEIRTSGAGSTSLASVLTIAGMAVEAIVAIDDYVPEPSDLE